MYYKNYSIICLVILCSISTAGLLQPENNSNLNYIHILFEWEQMSNADSYQLQVSKNEFFTDLVVDVIDPSLIYIEKTNIDWETTYYWRIRSMVDDNPTSDWSDPSYTFTTGQTRSNASATMYVVSEYGEGLTIFGAFFDYYSGIINENGNEIWNTGDENIVYYNTDYFGNLFGCQLRPELENNLPGMKFSIDSNILWEEPNDEFLHHDIFQLLNGNYLGITSVQQLGPIPIGSWTPLFMALGYQADGVTPEFIWEGDRLVEWDKDTKEIVWEWSTFDHFSMQDYDELGGTWYEALGQNRYDWTHSNAMWFDEVESAIYISVRHLSRITKIDYPSGEVIWNMGLEMPSGDINFGQDMLFSYQHSLQVLENGNILTLDNGNLSVQLRDTPYPTTRAIEIEVLEEDGNYSGEIVWEYNLPEWLFGFASGNVQKLYNDNYLITTVGNGGTSLEVSQTGEIVWEGNYNLSLPSGAVYRANRISGLYPTTYSILTLNLISDNEPTINLELGTENTVLFLLINETTNGIDLHYTFTDSEDWFGNPEGEFYLPPGLSSPLIFSEYIPNDPGTFTMELTVTPVNYPEGTKTVTLSAVFSELGVNEISIPSEIYLSNPYPNPFNPATKFDLVLSQPEEIKIGLFDLLGRNLDNIFSGKLSSGKYTYAIDNNTYPTGEYIIRVNTDNSQITKKIILLR